VMACVVLKPGMVLVANDLTSHCRQYIFSAPGPKTFSSQKHSHRSLVRMLISEVSVRCTGHLLAISSSRECCSALKGTKTMTSADLFASGTAFIFTSRSPHDEHALLHSPNPWVCMGTLRPHTMLELKTQ